MGCVRCVYCAMSSLAQLAWLARAHAGPDAASSASPSIHSLHHAIHTHYATTLHRQPETNMLRLSSHAQKTTSLKMFSSDAAWTSRATNKLFIWPLFPAAEQMPNPLPLYVSSSQSSRHRCDLHRPFWVFALPLRDYPTTQLASADVPAFWGTSTKLSLYFTSVYITFTPSMR